jgi:hypothetical protein
VSDTNEYRKEARDCLDLAAGSAAKRDKVFWLWLAHQWLALAQGIEEERLKLVLH